jgi:hypothetical protein
MPEIKPQIYIFMAHLHAPYVQMYYMNCNTLESDVALGISLRPSPGAMFDMADRHGSIMKQEN